MTLAVLYSRASVGIQAPLVTVETHISGGLPGFTIVGLPETAVKESKDRVRSALLNSKFEFPTSRITVNLAPADRTFLTAGGVFTDDLIDSYIKLKNCEITRLRMTTHPVEFEMYYSL